MVGDGGAQAFEHRDPVLHGGGSEGGKCALGRCDGAVDVGGVAEAQDTGLLLGRRVEERRLRGADRGLEAAVDIDGLDFAHGVSLSLCHD